MNWRFVDSDFLDGFTNMAIDEALITTCEKRDSLPVLRLYSWKPYAVSIGYAQKIEKAVNLEFCKKKNIDVVRRLTGGRTVFHKSEITYSVIIKESYPGMPYKVQDSYKHISRGVINGLRNLGAEVYMEESEAKAKTFKTEACFDVSGIFEIEHQSKKLVGSAQARKNGVIVQHGSILLDFNPREHSEAICSNQNLIPDMEKVLTKRVTTLKSITKREVKLEHVKKSIFEGFEKAFEINGRLGELSREEKEMALTLKKKYNSNEWLYKQANKEII